MSVTARMDQPPEQALYARWLGHATRAAMVLMVLGYVVYVAGWLPAALGPDEVARRWGMSAANFVATTGGAAGWSWVQRLPDAQAITLAGVAALAACSVPALLVIAKAMHTSGRTRCAMLALAQVAVIVLAASGLVAGGH